MKKQELFQLALMVCSFSELLIHAQQKRQIHAIDPVIDFRVPQSLMESLQEGINGVYTSLQLDTLTKNDLQHVESQMSGLIDLCDSAINRTRHNQVNEEDKAFLQKMIDRIDQLISQLEGDQKQDDEDMTTLRSIRSLCQNLKSKIA